MALLALCGNQLRRRSYFVWVAMTRKARYIDRAMHAGGRVGRLVRVTGGALHFDSFGWMRKVFDVGMTIGAPENPMNARRVFCRINCNISTRIGFHSRLAVASETAFILLQGCAAEGTALPRAWAGVGFRTLPKPNARTRKIAIDKAGANKDFINLDDLTFSSWRRIPLREFGLQPRISLHSQVS